MPKYHDLLPEELDEQNQTLLENLQHACQPDLRVARSLALIRKRLLIGDNVQERTNNVIPSQTRWQEKAVAPLPVADVPNRRKISLIAATLITALVVSLMVVTLHMTRGTKIASGSPPYTHQVSSLLNLHMVDSQTGWTTGTNGTVLRTTDGGLHWQDVTPQAALVYKTIWQNGTFDAFYGVSTAWITLTPNKDSSLYFRPANISLIFHTTNGGQTWQKTTLQTNGNITKEITFINAENGWLLTYTEEATHVATGPEHRPPSELYYTSDGGKIWTKILDAHSTRAAIFQDVDITGMSFSPGGQNGLITGVSTFTSTPAIYMTHDGGLNWQKLVITSPASRTSINDLFHPSFFTNKEAYLTANVVNASNATMGLSIFRTFDGGTTWTASPILRAVPFQPVPGLFRPGSARGASFIDRNNGWIVVLSGQANILYSTTDGGQIWKSVYTWGNNNTTSGSTPATPFSPSSAFDFISAKEGWVLGFVETVKGTTTTTLYRTVDGGSTWIQAPAHFPSFVEF